MDDKKKSRAGRPTAEQALRRALESFRVAGFDHSTINPLNIVALLAVDPAVAHEIRLAAALALHDRRGAGHPRHETPSAPDQTATPSDPGPPDDEIARRALEIMRRGTSR